MTDTDPPPSTGEEVLARLFAELERTPRADRPAVVARYCREWPHHADTIRQAAGLDAGLRPPPAETTAPVVRPGSRLGPFVVQSFVAHGGMGEVYKAVQDVLNRTVALKVVRGNVTDLVRTRFLREQRVLARLHQTNIVPVYYAGQHDGLQFYAMEYITGVPLHKVLTAVSARGSTAAPPHTTPPIPEVVASLLRPADAAPVPSAGPTGTRVQSSPPDDTGGTRSWAGPPVDGGTPADRPALRLSASYFASAAAVLAQVAEAVHHGHEHGILHRDIKPSNLIIDADGVCWVIDYGLARAVRGAAAEPVPVPDDDPMEKALTVGGVGTPQYMAPEQYKGGADRRSDVWSLGATLYELLTLRPAFPVCDTWAAMEKRVRTADPPPARRLVANVPADLEAICRKALAKDPADRYPTAAAFAADLRRWLNWEPTEARPGWRTLRPLRLLAWRHKGWAAAVVLLLAGLAGGNLVFAAQAEQRKRELEYTHLFARAEDIRHDRPRTGWAEELRAKLREAQALRSDAALRDHVLASYVGPDARIVRRHVEQVRNTERYVGNAGAVFGPNGRLLVGGIQQERPGRVDRTPALLFDANPAFAPTASTRPGGGPVAFPDADTPLQLLLPDGDARTLTLWNVGTNTAVCEITLPAEPRRIGELTAALSADGRRVAAAVADDGVFNPARRGSVTVWEVDPKKPGGKAVRVAGWDRPASALAFSPDGRLLAAGGADGAVTVHTAADGKEVLRLERLRVPAYSLAFGRRFLADATDNPKPPADRPDWLLAVGTNSGLTPVFDLRTGTRLCVCHGNDYANALAFSPDGGTLVTAGNNEPTAWDVPTGRPVFGLPHPHVNGTAGYKTGVAVSADGRRVAVTSVNMFTEFGGVTVTELDPDRGVQVYRGLTGPARGAWLSPSAKWVAALSHDWQLAVWERAAGRLAWVWDVPPGWTTDNHAVAFDEPAGTVYFASGTRVSRLNLTTGAKDRGWAVPPGLNDTLAVRPGRPPRLVRREPDGPIEANKPRPPSSWRGRELNEDGTLTETYRFPSALGSVAYSRLFGGGRFLGVTVHDKGDFLFDADTGEPLPHLGKIGRPELTVLNVSADGTRLAVGLGGDRMASYALPGMLTRGETVAADGGRAVACDDSHRLLACYGMYHDRAGMTLLRAGDTRPLVTLDLGRESRVSQQWLTPDGRFCYWGRDDGCVCVADVARCVELAAEFDRR